MLQYNMYFEQHQWQCSFHCNKNLKFKHTLYFYYTSYKYNHYTAEYHVYTFFCNYMMTR